MTWLAERLKALLQEQNLTVQELSDRTGLSRSYLSLIIHGRRKPPEDTIRRLATFFGEKPDQWVFHALKEPQVERIAREFPAQFEAVYTRKAREEAK